MTIANQVKDAWPQSKIQKLKQLSLSQQLLHTKSWQHKKYSNPDQEQAKGKEGRNRRRPFMKITKMTEKKNKNKKAWSDVKTKVET